MPFDYKEYEQKCSRMSKVELRNEIEHQKDVVATAGAGTGFAVLAIPLTMGLSAVAIGGTAPVIINARKKRAIAQRYLSLPGPEISSYSSTQTPPLRATNGETTHQRQFAEKPSQPQQQLPTYVNDYTGPDTREKQTYVPVEDVEMDLPPSYDEATLRRMTTMVMRSRTASQQHNSSTSSSLIPTSFESRNSGSHQSIHQGPANASLRLAGEEDIDGNADKGKSSVRAVPAQEDVQSKELKDSKDKKHGSWFSEFA